jgi:hypothetical protein
VQAAVTAASSSNLTAILPTGATYGPISETQGGLTAESSFPFLPTFPGGVLGSGSTLLSNSFNLGAGSFSCGVAIGDLDGDGKPDLVVANTADSTIWVYQNISSNGTLTAGSFAAPVVLAVNTGVFVAAPTLADLDGDGRLDILFPNYNAGTVSVFQNLSTPGNLTSNSFAPRLDYAVGAGPGSVAVSDLDGDGKPEIISANLGDSTISVLKNLSAGGLLTSNSFASPMSLATPASAFPNQVAVADIDGDGKFDLVTVNYGSSAGAVSIFRNTSSAGTISFAPRVDLPASGQEEALAVGDVDGDGKLDLIVSSDIGAQFFVYRNVGSPGSITPGSFAAPVTFNDGGRTHRGSIALGDIDGDGKLDVAIVDEDSNDLYLYRNLSSPGSFTSSSLASPAIFPAGSYPGLLAIGDLNGDGRPDIVIPDIFANGLTIWENVVPVQANPSCTPPPSGLVAWWQAEGNALDAVGGNNGAITGAVSFATGEVGQAFLFTDTNADIVIPASPSLNVGLGAGLTLEAWINPQNVTNTNPIFEWNPGDGVDYWGVGMYVVSDGVYNSVPVPGTLYANVQGVGDVWHQLWSAPGTVTNGGFQHVALTYDQASGVATLYCNGAMVAQQTFGSFTPKTFADLHLGRRPIDPAGTRFTFGGLMDEASVYDRALSASEIQTIYNAGAAGKCLVGMVPTIVAQPMNETVSPGATVSFTVTAGGSPTLMYQWYSGSGAIPGGTNATLTLNNVRSSAAGSYYAKVSDLYGSTNSESATLVVINPPPPGGVPTIAGFSPALAVPGSPVTISGANFDPASENNIVYFGAVQAAVTSASTSNLTVTLPVGATYGPITEMVGGLTGYSDQPFLPTFFGGNPLNSSSFSNSFNLSAGSGPYGLAIGDLDGDGKPDLVVADQSDGTIWIYRNIGTDGTLAAASFAPPVVLPSNGSSSSAGPVELEDLDGDGYLDIVTVNGNNAVSVYQNFSSPGNLTTDSFGPRVDIAVGSQPVSVAVADLDGDGRPDLIVANFGSNSLSVLQNISSGGVLTSNSFAAPVSLGVSGAPSQVVAADIDGDGKVDLVTANSGTYAGVSLFRNTSTPGSISFESQVYLFTYPEAQEDSIAVGDLDGDGKPDLIVGSTDSSGFSVYRNIGSPGSITTGSFAAPVGFSGSLAVGRGGIALADLDGDGKPDVVITGNFSLSASAYLFRNLSTPGSFTSASLAAPVTLASGNGDTSDSDSVAIGDLDGDGRPDIAWANFSGIRPFNYDHNLTVWKNVVPLIATAPMIISQPTNETVEVGGTASFAVIATGSPTLTYQWYNGSGSIGGATNSTLTLSNVQLSMADSYYVMVSNPYGSTNSASATLTVTIPAPPSCTPPPSGIAAWWRAEDNANDAINGNNGMINGGVSYAAGEVGQAFNFDGTTGYVSVPASPSLDIGAGSGMTIECWIAPDHLGPVGAAGRPIAEYSTSSAIGVHFWFENNYTLYANLVDTGGNYHQIISAPGTITTGVMQHVAVTYDKSSGNCFLYINGVQAASANFGAMTPQTSYPLSIGDRVAFGYPGTGSLYNGLMDELSLYSRALSANEIQSIFNAGSAGKCSSSVPPSCATAPSGMAAWWKAESNADDSVGANNGMLIGGMSFAPGEVGQAFVFDGSSGMVQVPASPSLNVGLGSGFTIEVWVNPATLNLQELCEWNQNNGVAFGADQIGVHMEINESPGDGSFWGNIVDTTGTSHNFHSANGIIVPNSFQHLAMTYDKASGQAFLYRNGEVVASANFGTITPQTSFDFFLGDRPSGFFTGIFFGGEMDEAAVYNRALAASEVQAVYNAGSAGKCSTNPQPPTCTPAPSGITAWWKAEGDAVDSIGGNNGTLMNGAGFQPGEVNEAFSLDGASQYVLVQAVNSNLDVGSGSGMTIEGWINPHTVDQQQLLCEWERVLGTFDGSDVGVDFAIQASTQLYANITDTSGNAHEIYAPANLLTANTWQHVVMTYDKASGVGALYINGTLVVSQDFGTFTPQTSFSNFLIGGRTTFASVSNPVTLFGGGMDEWTLYNRALSQSEIAAIYNAGSAGKCSNSAPMGPPVITNISPVSGDVGSKVSITGSNFSATPSNNVVYFGAVQAMVTMASTSNLTAVVPAGAIYGPISVTVNDLTGSSSYPFLATFPGNGPLSSSSFSNGFSLPAGNGPYAVAFGDLDGDGKPDVILANAFDGMIWVYRNIGSNGTLSAASFDAPLILEGAIQVGSVNNLERLTLADLDGDGRLDIVVANLQSGNVTVLQNLSSPGSLTTNSFAPRVDFAVGSGPVSVAVSDLDGDGKPEIISADFNSSTISVLRNISTPGLLTSNSFAPAISFATPQRPSDVAAGDIDGDGKFDIVTANYGSSSTAVSVFRNTSTLGTISFDPRVDLVANAGLDTLTIGDIDGDGKNDLVVGASQTTTFSVYRNIGSPGSITTGSFAVPVTFTFPGIIGRGGIAWGDIDGDGRPDLAIASQNSGNMYLFRNLSTPGSFTSSSLGSPVTILAGDHLATVVVGDLDGDGRPDVCVANDFGNNLRIYQNVTPFIPPPAPPVITSFTPVSGAPGTVINIEGLNFSATPGSNIVYFGAVQAVVTQASPNNLVVTVPAGATFAPISETVNGLTAYSGPAFLATFPGSSPLSSTSLSNSFNLAGGSGPNSVVIADIDGDGKPDLVFDNDYEATIWIYRNIGSSGELSAASFAPPVKLTGSSSVGPADTLSEIAVADLDGDGRLDIVVANYYTSVVSVFQNLSSPGSLTSNSFGSRLDLGVGNSPVSVAVSDLDGDGKPDVITADFGGGTLSILRNISTGGLLTSNSFAAPVSLTVPGNPSEVVARDINGDGKVDLITANHSTTSDAVSLFENTSTPGNITFAPRVDLAAPTSLEEALAVEDIDGDGKMDLIVGSYFSANFSVYRNVGGSGSITVSSFATPVTFAAGAQIHRGGIALGDIDGDGKPDIAIVGEYSSSMYLYRNLSTPGNFTASSLATPVTFDSGYNSVTPAIGDLDGDGRPDIVIANAYGGNLTVWKNVVPSTGANPPPAVPVITAFAPSSGGPGTIVNIQGLNFSAAAGSNIVYFGAVQAVVTEASPSNLVVTVPAGATFAPISETVNGLTAYSGPAFLATFPGSSPLSSSSLSNSFNLDGGSGPFGLVIGDLDGDGKPDLIFVNDYEASLWIYQNIGSNGTLAASSFAAPVKLPFNVPLGTDNLITVALADLDGDGRLDIVTENYSAGTVSVIQNLSSPGILTSNSFGSRLDFEVGSLPASVAVADLDGDGRPDITVANFGDGTLSILRNMSTGGLLTSNSFAAPITLATAGGTAQVVARDIDGDGKVDLVTANYSTTSDAVSVFQNTSTPGNITFAPRVDLAGPDDSQEGLAVGDIDGDGKPDLIVGSYRSANFSVYRNIGSPGSITTGSFAVPVTFVESAQVHRGGIALADIDGDGKLDVAIVGEYSGSLYLYRNLSTPGSFTTSSLAAPVTTFDSGYNSTTVAIGDLDGDGRPDVVIANAYGNNLTVWKNVVPVGTNPQSCTPPPSGLVSWWRAEGDATDEVGGNNGMITGAVSFASGEVGQAFHFTDTNEDIVIPASSNLNVGLGAGLTLEAWINPDNVTNYNPIFEWNRGDGVNYWGVGFFVLSGSVYNTEPVPGTLYANVQGVGDVWHQLWSAPGTITNGGFQHVALTYDKASGLATLYCNGAIVAQQNFGSFTPKTIDNLHIGRRPTDPAGDRFTFLGSIDEPSVYNRALSQSEIQAIYNAGSAGKCFTGVPPTVTAQPVNQNVIVGGTTSFFVNAAGTSPLSYQWFHGNTSIPSATNLQLVLSNVQPSQAGLYHVTVSNPYGSTNSASATLTVNFPPATVQVVNTTANPVGTNSATVPINLLANGNENALNFSLSFDTNLLRYASAFKVSAAINATLVVDASQAGSGRLGIKLTLPSGETYSSGTNRILIVTFTSKLTGTQAVTTVVGFAMQPVGPSLTDTNGSPLAFSLHSGTLTLSPKPPPGGSVVTPQQPTLNISSSGGNVVLSWPTWAGDYNLQAAESLSAPVNWTNVPVTLETNGGNVQVTLPATASQMFFQLYSP